MSPYCDCYETRSKQTLMAFDRLFESSRLIRFDPQWDAGFGYLDAVSDDVFYGNNLVLATIDKEQRRCLLLSNVPLSQSFDIDYPRNAVTGTLRRIDVYRGGSHIRICAPLITGWTEVITNYLTYTGRTRKQYRA